MVCEPQRSSNLYSTSPPVHNINVVSIYYTVFSTIMSGSTSNSAPLQKHKDATVSDSKGGSQPQKPAVQLEEDDEFEDFPIEGGRKL